MKKRFEDEMDEERIHRQLREINDEFTKEKMIKAAANRPRETPLANNTPRKREIDIMSMAGNHIALPRDNLRSQMDQRTDLDRSGFDSVQKGGLNDSYSNNPNRMRNERDNYEFMIEKSLHNLKQEAT